MDSAVGYLLLFFGSVVFGGVALMLGGVAAHHGLLWVPGALLVGLSATWLRARIVARRRRTRLSWFGLARVSIQMLLLVELGYALAHVLHNMPNAARISLGLSAALLLGAGAILAVNRAPRAVFAPMAPAARDAEASNTQDSVHDDEGSGTNESVHGDDAASANEEVRDDDAASADDEARDAESSNTDDESRDSATASADREDEDEDGDEDEDEDEDEDDHDADPAAIPPPPSARQPRGRLERGLNWALAHPWTLSALIVMTLIPWWRPPTQTLRELVALEFQARGLEAKLDTLQWVDEPFAGVRTGFTAARAVVLGAERDAPTDVYLVRAALSHSGAPTRITGAYNLTDTAAVEEAKLAVWQKWAVWEIVGDGGTQNIEIADLRGEPPTRGAGWTNLKRLQQQLTNLQATGQTRGLRRSSLILVEPARDLTVSVADGALDARVHKQHARLELGSNALVADANNGLSLVTQDVTLPGDLTTWAVDRLRAMPWVGSDRMQWVKAIAFRLFGELEELERDVVGIDADETIAEELGDVLEGMPLAKAGQVPNWPPIPIEPILAVPMAGEGKWVDLSTDPIVGEGPDTPSPVVFSFLRAERERPYIQVSIVLWDPRRLKLSMVAGTAEPKSMTGQLGSGQIPRDPRVLPRLVGAFNGAFQALHGEFGMVESQRVILPPKPYAATVVELEDGAAGFGTWPREGAIPANVMSLRQNMTPLLVDDRINPYRRQWWGGVPEGWNDMTRTVRSGLCMTREGYVGYFYSASIAPDNLAAAMKQTGCEYGMHLDMNAMHTGFEFYRVAPRGQLPTLQRRLDPKWEAQGDVPGIEGFEFVSRMLVRKMPLMNFPRYIDRVSRDFFFLTRRVLLPSKPLEPLIPEPGDDGRWRVADITGNEWPHALALTRLQVPRDATTPMSYRLTQVDPKQVAVSSSREGAVLELAVSKTDGELGLWLTPTGFRIAAQPPRRGARFLAFGAAHSDSATAAVCIGDGNLLTWIESERRGWGATEGLKTVISSLACDQQMFLAGAAHALLPGVDPSEQPTGEEMASRSWLTRKQFSGTQRIFVDTPIVAPEDWAYIQRRRVPYQKPAADNLAASN